MNKTIPHIKIEMKIIQQKEICEISMYGDAITISSMIFSAMMTDDKFAECVLDASKSFINAKTDERVFLN